MAAVSRFVGEFALAQAVTDALRGGPIAQRVLPCSDECSALCLSGPLLTSGEGALLERELDKQVWVTVGTDGVLANYTAGQPAGSLRASAYCPELADELWRRLKPALPGQRALTALASTDWDRHPRWRPVGVNPLMRFIRYLPGHQLVAHYDAPYVFDERRRTLMSLVIYLSDAPCASEGGATRMLHDTQHTSTHETRDFSDWRRCAVPSEVARVFRPHAGGALVFDHRLLHDGEPLSGQARKTILRTDVVFEKC
ncbi:2OG-Fe(II) oxygenase [Burkholderia cenocepacia]|uniref:2OG-Fe(II) oxygenase n=1 Tax=Burkholderia cenocepacia TaxID=95486 RepID=UPI00076119B2|nr:2OG-Fe(II) oxygenase [Burkholderia cenocepacia]KWU26440.1 hypothetical protein AS149_25980 [Burkholderia cenocepacia]